MPALAEKPKNPFTANRWQGILQKPHVSRNAHFTTVEDARDSDQRPFLEVFEQLNEAEQKMNFVFSEEMLKGYMDAIGADIKNPFHQKLASRLLMLQAESAALYSLGNDQTLIIYGGLSADFFDRVEPGPEKVKLKTDSSTKRKVRNGEISYYGSTESIVSQKGKMLALIRDRVSFLPTHEEVKDNTSVQNTKEKTPQQEEFTYKGPALDCRAFNFWEYDLYMLGAISGDHQRIHWDPGYLQTTLAAQKIPAFQKEGRIVFGAGIAAASIIKAADKLYQEGIIDQNFDLSKISVKFTNPVSEVNLVKTKVTEIEGSNPQERVFELISENPLTRKTVLTGTISFKKSA